MKKFIQHLFVAMFCAFSAFGVASACTSNQIDVNGDGTNCVDTKFSVTTTSLPTNQDFNFYMSAGGTFYVDCGTNGTLSGTGVSGKTITRSVQYDSETLYSCTYTTGGVKTIKFGGLATGYGTAVQYPAIRLFSGEINRSANSMTSGGTEIYIASISGSIGAIFPTLGSGLTKQPGFYMSFRNMTNINGSIPAGLFSGIYGTANSWMFYSIFSRSSFTGQIPAGLFAGITSAGTEFTFGYTFAGCKGLTGSIPDRLFANITSAGTYAFFGTFKNCTGLTGYIPADLFAGLIANGSPYSQEMMEDVFIGTNLATTCPTGTTIVNTGYESYWDGHVACKVDWPFSLTTTNLSAGSIFKFQMSAAGVFYVDWGDGSAVQTIDRTGDTTLTQYTHTFATAGSYIIKFAGLATGYNTNNDYVAAIRFGVYTNNDTTPELVVSISGSLGAIFPTLNNGSYDRSKQPLFARTFNGCTNLTSISATLFNGVIGGAEAMFGSVFKDCSSLTSIPSGLFNGVSRAAKWMFSEAFSGCSGLTSLPSGLFSGISGVEAYTFYQTFYHCSNLAMVPYNLFSGVSGTPGYEMFAYTFDGDTALNTFVLADGTTTVNYIPAQFFGTISGGSDVMRSIFSGNTAIASSCPNGTVQNITGYESQWNSRVSCIPTTITINWGNGNGGIHASTQCTYGGDITTPTTAPVKRGYRFIGWVFD